jgi:hypothetical protein
VTDFLFQLVERVSVYGPVGAYFLHLKTYTENAYGEEKVPYVQLTKD